jgi:hypothetical protein
MFMGGEKKTLCTSIVLFIMIINYHNAHINCGEKKIIIMHMNVGKKYHNAHQLCFSKLNIVIQNCMGMGKVVLIKFVCYLNVINNNPAFT